MDAGTRPVVRDAVTPIRQHIIVTEPVPTLIGPGLETNQCNGTGVR